MFNPDFYRITLVGRSSRLAFDADQASFLLTVKGKGQRPELVVKCQAWSRQLLEQFETMDDGSLVGVIGTLRSIEEQDAHAIVRLDRLKILGKPQEVAA